MITKSIQNTNCMVKYKLMDATVLVDLFTMQSKLGNTGRMKYSFVVISLYSLSN